MNDILNQLYTRFYAPLPMEESEQEIENQKCDFLNFC